MNLFVFGEIDATDPSSKIHCSLAGKISLGAPTPA
jgi:hypothetical protein